MHPKGKGRRKGSTSGSTSGNSTLLIQAMHGGGEKFNFDPALDEWRFPTHNDCTPSVGDVVSVKWKDSKTYEQVRVVEVDGKTGGLFRPLVVEATRSRKKKKGRRRRVQQRWSFHPKTDAWYWPEVVEGGSSGSGGEDESGSGGEELDDFFPTPIRIKKKSKLDGWCCIKLTVPGDGGVPEQSRDQKLDMISRF